MVGIYATTKPPAIVLRVSRRDGRLFFESDELGIFSSGIVTSPREITLTSEAMLTLAVVRDENGDVQRYDLGDIQLRRQSLARQ